MTRFLLLLVLFTFGCAPAQAQKPRAYEASLTRLLGGVLTESGAVHYDRLATGPQRARLDSLLAVLETYPLGTLTTDAAKKAFWINAYNALMLDAVARQSGRTDVLGSDEGAVFFKTARNVGGLRVTLDQIENVILRRQEGPAEVVAHRVERLDPRIHVALNCAAVSCPRLRPVALTPANLDAQLDAGMKAFADSPKHFDVEGGAVRVSSLLDWFGADFDRRAPAGSYVVRFMSPDRPGYAVLRDALDGKSAEQIRAMSTGARPGVVYFYDWALNRASRNR